MVLSTHGITRVSCSFSNMENENFITENFPTNCRKPELVENKDQDIFIHCLVFLDEIIVPLL